MLSWERTWSVEALAAEACKDSSSNPRYSPEKLGMVLCDSSVSGQRQEGRWGLLASSLAPGFTGEPVSEESSGVWWSRMFDVLLKQAPTCTCVHTPHTQVHTRGKKVWQRSLWRKTVKKNLCLMLSSFILKTLSNWNQSATWYEISVSVGFVLLQGRVSSEGAS